MFDFCPTLTKFDAADHLDNEERSGRNRQKSGVAAGTVVSIAGPRRKASLRRHHKSSTEVHAGIKRAIDAKLFDQDRKVPLKNAWSVVQHHRAGQ